MKRRDYTSLSLRMGVIFLLTMFFFMFLSIILDIVKGTSAFEILRIFILGSYSIVILSLLCSFFSIVYNQFRNRKILWGVINIILFILFLASRGNEEDYTAVIFIILLISCLRYYFVHIKPKFKKKK